ncbi:putative phosphoesterase [Lachnospiraceae bacterium PF1-21]|uniref:Phosphoesterase n=1 Tax=Ohessyouella blattaphilus TaxID=2949333 RepID=A0ABT1EE72_9FIRM|nr:metallophosphoesterase [Ohessyouella blattaphilus]MCP1109004.1 metallophosphoesterase [Ohessyouella blattaphilus]MCR8562398.1 metallophosphoesterase [Ohessyouella blattaphilus]MDL2249741.1 metallophosphoesterase [Lachnospiraceae bacterium OttesenSCG-928-J05]
MKVLIVSDTHKAHNGLKEAIKREAPLDMLIHLGDGEGYEDEIKEMANCPVHIIGGNNDFFCDLAREEEFFICGVHVFITHGHAYFVSLDEERLLAEGRGRGADIIMYGHTHKPSVHEEGATTILNPGSISYPRQEGRKPSYIVMNADLEEKPKFDIKYL